MVTQKLSRRTWVAIIQVLDGEVWWMCCELIGILDGKGRKNGLEVEMCSKDVIHLLQALGVGSGRTNSNPWVEDEAYERGSEDRWDLACDSPWFQMCCVRVVGHGGKVEDRSFRSASGHESWVLSVMNSGNGAWSYWSRVVWEKVGEWLLMASFLELLSWVVHRGETGGAAEGQGREWGLLGWPRAWGSSLCSS